MSEQALQDTNRLEHFPVSFFAMVMGLTGLTLGWHKGSEALGLSDWVGHTLATIALLAFVVLGVIYLMKIIRYPAAVKEELKHPVKLSFFPAISISMILLSVCFLPIYPGFSKALWLVGIVVHLGLMLFVVSSWVNHDHFQVGHLNPSWFIPAVGNVLVPIAGIPLGFVEISWFYFSIGMIFWIILLVIVFNRVLFHDPMPARLLPTMFILIAPPAVGFVAYVKLAGGLDSFGRILYYIGLFFTLFLVVQVPRFAKLPFFLSWWAYSFPLAAITVATFVMHDKTGLPGFEYLGFVLLAVLTSVIAMLLTKTLKATMAGKICVPE